MWRVSVDGLYGDSFRAQGVLVAKRSVAYWKHTSHPSEDLAQSGFHAGSECFRLLFS